MNLKTAVERCQPFDTPAVRATDRTVSHLTKPANNAGKVIGYQGERLLTKLEATPFVLRYALLRKALSTNGVATTVFRMKWIFALLLCLSAACASAEQELKPFVRGSQQAIVAAHQGKPFILVLWSLDCTHCLDDMALFGKLAKEYRDLDLVLVSTDSPQQKQEIAAMLQRHHLDTVESWVFADSFVERLRYEVDAQWYGELPRTYFFDAQGQSVAMSGKLERGRVERWIKSRYHG